jgi:hypothetical protein
MAWGVGVAFIAECIAECDMAEGVGELCASADPVSALHMSAMERRVRIEGSFQASNESGSGGSHSDASTRGRMVP